MAAQDSAAKTLATEAARMAKAAPSPAPPGVTTGTVTLGQANLGMAPPAAASRTGPAGNDSDLEIAKQMILQLESRVRHLEAITMEKVQVRVDYPPYVAAMAALKHYQTQAQANPTGHGLGPPHPHMFMAFLKEMIVQPYSGNLDPGIRGRILVFALMASKISTFTADQVDIMLPYFTLWDLTGPHSTGYAMISYHLRGTTMMPDGADLDDLTTKAIQAVNSQDWTAVVCDVDRAFVFADGLPVAPGVGGTNLGRALSSVLCTTGGTRPTGRAPASGKSRKLKKKGSRS